MFTQNWPKHEPGTTLHQVMIDGVSRDFDDAQIIEETLGLADKVMIDFYRKAFYNDMIAFFKEQEERFAREANEGLDKS